MKTFRRLWDSLLAIILIGLEYTDRFVGMVHQNQVGAVTTETVMADTVPTVLKNARFTEQFIAVMSALVWRIAKPLHDGKNVNVPTFGTISAHALAEGIDMTASETMSDTSVTITPAEVGCKLIVTDKLVRDDNEDIKSAAGRLLGNAMELKRDTDLLALFASAATALGSGGTATMGQYAAARAILKGNVVSSGGPAPGSLVAVLHPFVTLDIIDILTPIIPTAGTAMSQSVSGPMMEDVVRNYGVGRLFGMNIIEDGNITPAAGTCHGGVFATGEGGAIILATANEWSVEPERDGSLRATELNIVGEYGVGYYLNNWAVDMNHDAATPA